MAQKSNRIAGNLKDFFWAAIDTVAIVGACYILEVYFNADEDYLTPLDVARIGQNYVVIGVILMISILVSWMVQALSKVAHADVDAPDLPRQNWTLVFLKSNFKAVLRLLQIATVFVVQDWQSGKRLEDLLHLPAFAWELLGLGFLAFLVIEFFSSAVHIIYDRVTRGSSGKSWLA